MSVTKKTKKRKPREQKKQRKQARDPTCVWPVARWALITAIVSWLLIWQFAMLTVVVFFIPLVGLVGYVSLAVPFIIAAIFALSLGTRARGGNRWATATGALGVLLWIAYGITLIFMIHGGFE